MPSDAEGCFTATGSKRQKWIDRQHPGFYHMVTHGKPAVSCTRLSLTLSLGTRDREGCQRAF